MFYLVLSLSLNFSISKGFKASFLVQFAPKRIRETCRTGLLPYSHFIGCYEDTIVYTEETSSILTHSQHSPTPCNIPYLIQLPSAESDTDDLEVLSNWIAMILLSLFSLRWTHNIRICNKTCSMFILIPTQENKKTSEVTVYLALGWDESGGDLCMLVLPGNWKPGIWSMKLN
jgi:hypothetical protein